jgi:hypothetical protein
MFDLYLFFIYAQYLIHLHVNNQSPAHTRPGTHHETAYSLTAHLLHILYFLNMCVYC